MTISPVISRPEIPAGPPKLTPRQLRDAQAQTLDAPRLRYGLLARALFTTMDLAYGRARTIVKFTMLEFIARVPYQAWERMGYLALARYRPSTPSWKPSPTPAPTRSATASTGAWPTCGPWGTR